MIGINSSDTDQILKPYIFKEGSFTAQDIEDFKSSHAIWKVNDMFSSQVSELIEIQNPSLDHDSVEFKQKHQNIVTKKDSGCWVYFPWSGVMLHMVNEIDLLELRTNRNKNLITAEEQHKIYNSSVAVTGLSVGNSIAVTMAYSGMCRNIKLADFDLLETANLNRLRSGLPYVGTHKAIIAAQQIWELNPYADINIYPEGVNAVSVDAYLSDPKVDILFDEIDDFEMKIRLRLQAKNHGIPVIMMTTLGDTILVDVERYDLDQNIEIFNGLAGDEPARILESGSISEQDKVRYAMSLVGVENVPARAVQSLSEIGRSLVGRPQLASTISIDGGVAAYVVKNIILGRELNSGRYRLSLDSLFNTLEPDHDKKAAYVENVISKMRSNE